MKDKTCDDCEHLKPIRAMNRCFKTGCLIVRQTIACDDFKPKEGKR